MQFGAFIFPTDYSIRPAELGREMEERGFESLFFAEHSHIPTSRETPYPGGGDLPKEYADTMDPFVALATVAQATERLRLGTGIALVIQRDPIHLAKEVSTLDLLSRGRVLLGIGGGWNKEEMRDHGTDPAHRWKLLRERIETMKALWTQSKAEYHGDLVDLPESYQWPKPVQQPHPPILVGGQGPNTLRRVIAYGDGWMPNRVANLAERMAELRELAEAAGRDPIPVTVYGVRPTPEGVERMLELGVSRVIFPLPPAPAETVIPFLDKQARLIEQYRDA